MFQTLCSSDSGKREALGAHEPAGQKEACGERILSSLFPKIIEVILVSVNQGERSRVGSGVARIIRNPPTQTGR